MYLIDTNVWLERLLDQAKSNEVGQFFSHTPTEQLFVSDFAFHSICVVLTRLKQSDALLRFVRDSFEDGAVSVAHLEPEDMQRLVRVMSQFKLDFDDAYQYVIAEKYRLTIVSYDGDFDRTERGRFTPAQVV